MKVKTIIIIAALLAAPTALAAGEGKVITSTSRTETWTYRIHFDRHVGLVQERLGTLGLGLQHEWKDEKIDIKEGQVCKLNDKLTEVDETTCQSIESVDTTNTGIGVFEESGQYQLKELTDTNKPSAKCAIIGTANTIISFEGGKCYINRKIGNLDVAKLRTELPGHIKVIGYSERYEETIISEPEEADFKDDFRRELEKIKGEATDDEIKTVWDKILGEVPTIYSEKYQLQLEQWWHQVLAEKWPNRFTL